MLVKYHKLLHSRVVRFGFVVVVGRLLVLGTDLCQAGNEEKGQLRGRTMKGNDEKGQ